MVSLRDKQGMFISVVCVLSVTLCTRDVWAVTCPGPLSPTGSTSAPCNCTTADDGVALTAVTCSGLNKLDMLQFQTYDAIIQDLIIKNCNISKIQEDGFPNLKVRYVEVLNCGIKTLQSNAFRGIGEYVEHLSLSHNDISEIVNGTFSNLPHLIVLTLGYNQIKALAPGVFSGLTAVAYLELSGNSIQTLPDNVFNDLPSLQYLYLQHNHIETISSTIFNGLLNLLKLFLFENRISVIEAGALDKLKRLESLDLSFNQIASIPENLLLKATELTKLRLNNNKISIIPETLFFQCVKLDHLDLSFNNITTLNTDPFHRSLNLLQELYMNNNQIYALTSDLFETLTNLKIFHLDHNSIHLMDLNCLTGLHELRELYIQCNKITVVPFGVFDQSGRVNLIDLSHNKIYDIELEPFLPLRDLQYLDMSWNNLNEIRNDWFLKSHDLLELKLDHNHINKIMNYSFDNLISVSKISLNNNRIHKVPDDLFYNCANLTYLDMSTNPLGDIQEDLFIYQKKLQTLNLTQTCLREFPTKSVYFQGHTIKTLKLGRNSIANLGIQHLNRSTSTIHLDLSYNNISSMDMDTFRHMNSVQQLNLTHNNLRAEDLNKNYKYLHNIIYLDISWNNIKYVQHSDLSNLVNLTDLRLSGNPLECNCESAYLRSMVYLTDYQDLVCQDPYYFTGTNVVCFVENNFRNDSCTTFPQLADVKIFCNQPQYSSVINSSKTDINSRDRFDLEFCVVESNIPLQTTIATIESMESEPIFVAVAKVNITTIVSGVDYISVKWNYDGKEILGYEIHYREFGSDIINTTYVSGKRTSLTISGLKHGTNYVMCIYVITINDKTIIDEDDCIEVSTVLLVKTTDAIEPDTEEESELILPILLACSAVLIVIIIIIIAICLSLRKRRNKAPNIDGEGRKGKKEGRLTLNKKLGMWVSSFSYSNGNNEQMVEQTTLSLSNLYKPESTEERTANGWTAQNGTIPSQNSKGSEDRQSVLKRLSVLETY